MSIKYSAEIKTKDNLIQAVVVKNTIITPTPKIKNSLRFSGERITTKIPALVRRTPKKPTSYFSSKYNIKLIHKKGIFCNIIFKTYSKLS